MTRFTTAAAGRGARRRWVGVILGLLSFCLVTQGILLAFALGDPSFAIEPDYENRALHHDDEARQAWTNQQLGWSVAVERVRVSGATLELVVVLHDRYGRPIDGATVNSDAFHNARAARVASATLFGTGGGRYAGTFALARPGLHEFRLRAARGTDHFTATLRADARAYDATPADAR